MAWLPAPANTGNRHQGEGHGPVRNAPPRQDGASDTAVRLRRCAAGRAVHPGQRGRRRGDAADCVGRRRPLLRHRSLVRPRPERAPAGTLPLPPAAGRVYPLDQGRARAARAAQPGALRHRVLGRRPPLRAPLGLRLRRHHAVLRGQPAAAGAQPHRPAADPRPRLVAPRHRRRGRCLARPAPDQRLARAGGAQVIRRDQGHRRRRQPARHHPALPRHRRCGLLPARAALHADGAGHAGDGAARLREARRRHRCRRRLLFRHHRYRRGLRRQVQLRRRRRGGAGEGAADRGDLRGAWRAAARRRPPVPARAPPRRLRHSGGVLAGPHHHQPGAHALADPGGPVGRAQA
jgi:hypothetical protein